MIKSDQVKIVTLKNMKIQKFMINKKNKATANKSKQNVTLRD